MAAIIDASNANGTLASWGESPGGYYGQSFTAASGSLTQLQFTFTQNSGTTDYKVYIVTWDGSHSGSILWQSPLLSVGPLSSAQLVTVSIPNLQLTEGSHYAFILDSSVGILNGPGSASVAALDPFSPGYSGGYAGGEFFFNPSETGTVEGNLAASPIILSSFDMAFSLTFSDFVNSAPTAAPDTIAVTEDRTGTGNVLANDGDPDIGDQILVTAVSFGAQAGAVGAALHGLYGTLTLHQDGSYSYAADADLLDTLSGVTGLHDVFSYQITDSHGGTAVSTLTVNVSLANDAIITRGGNGPDTIFGDRNGLIGAEDTIYGGNANDSLFGLAGADVLYGENGNDRLTGGSGPDAFVFAKNGGDDIVTDFNSGIDDIILNGITLRSVSRTDVDGNGVADVVLQFSSGSATLLNPTGFDAGNDVVVLGSAGLHSASSHGLVGLFAMVS